MTSLALALVSLVSPPQTAAPASGADAVAAIVGARLEIGDGRVVERGTIVIRGDRIVAIGADVAVPSGARTIEGEGLTVFPGFIDAYSTSGLKLPPAAANVGPVPDTQSTAPATMWAGNRKGIRADVRAASAIDPSAGFAPLAAQGITAVLLSGGDGSIAGTAALVATNATRTVLLPEAAEEFAIAAPRRPGTPSNVASPTTPGTPPGRTPPGGTLPGQTPPGAAPSGQNRPGQNPPSQNPPGQNPPGAPPNNVPPVGAPGAPGRTPGSGANAAPTYEYPGTLYGITALVRQTLHDARAYAAETKPTPDPTYEALRPLVTGRMPALFTVATGREIARVARIAEEFDLRMIVNGAPDAYRMIDVLKRRNAPVIVSLEVPEEPRRTLGSDPEPVPVRVLEDRYAQYNEQMGNARRLDEAGVLIAFRHAPSGEYLTGVRKFVAASGLSRAAALRAMTINPARIFGVESRTGTLEVGKRADLVLMTGDFLDEKATIRTVLVGGVAFDPPKPAVPTASTKGTAR